MDSGPGMCPPADKAGAEPWTEQRDGAAKNWWAVFVKVSPLVAPVRRHWRWEEHVASGGTLGRVGGTEAWRGPERPVSTQEKVLDFLCGSKGAMEGSRAGEERGSYNTRWVAPAVGRAPRPRALLDTAVQLRQCQLGILAPGALQQPL